MALTIPRAFGTTLLAPRAGNSALQSVRPSRTAAFHAVTLGTLSGSLGYNHTDACKMCYLSQLPLMF